MADLTKDDIRTNNVPRDILYWHDIPESDRNDFDYITDTDDANFFRYKDSYYDLAEFISCSSLPDFSPLKDWDGYCSDSFFSGIVVKYANHYESVIVGYYCN